MRTWVARSTMTRADVRHPQLVARLGATLLVGLSGCGNTITTEITGRTGITVTADGDPVAVIAVCSEYVDTVRVVLGRQGLDDDETNPPVGTWASDQQETGLVDIDLLAPEPPWQGPPAVRFEEDLTYIVGADAQRRDISAGQVSFIGADLADFKPGTVYSALDADGGLTPTPQATFLTESCALLEQNQ